MLSPSWPAPPRAGRRSASPRIRRRLDAAQRRALRLAVWAGAVATICLASVHAAVLFVVGGESARTLALIEVGGMVVVLGIAIAARRVMMPPEPLAMALLLVGYGLAYAGYTLDPASKMLAVGGLATIIVGSGLFMPWSSRWHAVWLSVAVLAGLAYLLPTDLGVPFADRVALMPTVLIAAVTSLVGQYLWQAPLRRMVQQQFEMRSLHRYSLRQEARVSELNRELNRAARLDALTGIGNRLALDEALARLLDQGDRVRPQRFAMVLFDIDHFKDYNDEHGHLAGDAALDRVGDVLRRATRGDDLAFRFGGEEFLLLLPQVDLTGAIAVAERVRVQIEEAVDGAPPFTISGGVALCDPADGRDPSPLLRRADAALYLAKRAGRNRIAADELSVTMQRGEIASA
ncbi:MAG: diguanylate cyclase domain-containing protein [Candidatus Limnocylindria bacterium]